MQAKRRNLPIHSENIHRSSQKFHIGGDDLLFAKFQSLRGRMRIILPAAILYLGITLIWTWSLGVHWSFLLLQYAALTLLVGEYIMEARGRIAERENWQRSEDRIRHMAYYDDLTGLPNRRSFHDHLADEMAKRTGTESKITVFYLDIDRFKLVNDSLGHDFGDILLLHVAERLTRIVGKDDFVARMEGDEFALCYPCLKDESEAFDIADNIKQVLEPAFVLQEYEIHISASIGISMMNEGDDKAADLMRRADMALSRAKEKGRNNYQMFNPSLNLRTMERLTMENDLRKALAEKQFTLHYQPQMDTITGEIICFEALIRWNHPEKGLIPPNKFIPLTEENGMIIVIGEWVIREACRQNKKWQQMGLPHIPVAVNLSARQFHQRDLSERIANILRETELEAKYLELEVTESIMMDYDHAFDSLRKMRQLGVQISVDDFGTGYSSLSYLKKMPIDKLKIDRSFVRDVLIDTNDAAIVSTIIAMARTLQLKVIAEGVETREQFVYLYRNRCDQLQGHLLSPPLPPEEITERWLSLQETAVAHVQG